jgi:SAM-dependent methyltransferase
MPTSSQGENRDGSLYLHRGLYHRGVAEREEEFVIAMLRPRQERVLEVGPGTGRITRHLAQLARSLVVCDHDASALGRLRERLADERIEYQPIALENLEQTPGYGGFDAAVAVRVVPHAADWRAAVDQLLAAVRPGALAIFDLWNRQSFVGALMKVFPRDEPVHRLIRCEIREKIASLPADVVATYRWGYPRIGAVHADDLGAALFPSWAYSTLYCLRKRNK